jgi:hypothetical protein
MIQCVTVCMKKIPIKSEAIQWKAQVYKIDDLRFASGCV